MSHRWGNWRSLACRMRRGGSWKNPISGYRQGSPPTNLKASQTMARRTKKTITPPTVLASRLTAP
jgi:hypothetical protein